MADETRKRLVTLEHLKKTFVLGWRRRRVHAVVDANLHLYENEIVGLVGPNGAGKTTTMKMLTGLVKPNAGVAELFGQPVARASARNQLGYLPENPYFYEHLTGRELLKFYGNLYGLGDNVLRGRIDALIERVNLEHAAHRPIKNYSKGMRQRIGIAQALINDPQLVILDEPQSGLDPLGRKAVRDIILEQRDLGKTVLFSSHILPDVEAVCDRIIVMKAGRTVELGDAAWRHVRYTEERLITALPGPSSTIANENGESNDAAGASGTLVADDRGPLMEALEQVTGTTGVCPLENGITLRTTTRAATDAVVQLLLARGWRLDRVEEPSTDYESLLLTVLEQTSGERATG